MISINFIQRLGIGSQGGWRRGGSVSAMGKRNKYLQQSRCFSGRSRLLLESLHN
jgi:hypothetical protein